MNWFQKHIFSNQTWLLPMLFVWVSINLYGQEDEVDLYGSWQLQKHPEYKTVYQELYFDGKSLFIYDEHVQLKARREYRIANNELQITKGLEAGETMGKIVVLTSDNFVIEINGVQAEYLNLSNSENNLEELILEKITQNDFSFSFYKRHKAWLSNQ